jgi:transposase
MTTPDMILMTSKMEDIRKKLLREVEIAREEMADYLSNFDLLIMPILDTRSWKRKMGKKTRRVCDYMGFGQLYTKLRNKCAYKKTQMIEVSEAWTTKFCSCCSAINDPRTHATYTCSTCGAILNRDENAARCLLMLTMGQMKQWMIENRSFD